MYVNRFNTNHRFPENTVNEFEKIFSELADNFLSLLVVKADIRL